MSEDPQQPAGSPEPPPAKPFEASPRELRSAEGGCSRMALVGCGVVAFLLALVVVTVLLKARDLAAWSLGTVLDQIESTLPEDLDQQDRDRLRRAADAVLDKIEDGDLDPVALQALQADLLAFVGRGQSATREEFLALVEGLEAFAGIDAPGSRAMRGSQRRSVGESFS